MERATLVEGAQCYGMEMNVEKLTLCELRATVRSTDCGRPGNKWSVCSFGAADN
jgi:hypothetical protein